MKIITMSLTLNLIILCSVVSSCLAKDHSVTWGTGVDYTTWANGKDIRAGDNLVFKYADGHTVSQVSEEDYKSCNTSKVYTEDRSGRTVIPLNNAGTRYFICTVPGHCQGGMKLAVTAGDAPLWPSPAVRGCRKPPPSPGPSTLVTEVPSSSAAVSPLAAMSVALLGAAVLVSLV